VDIDALCAERDRRSLEALETWLAADASRRIYVAGPSADRRYTADLLRIGSSDATRVQVHGSSLGDAFAQAATVILAGGAS
jgi:hypothetical protein